LRNRGVAGELLDLQLGSSDRVATTNDPLFLSPEDKGYVYVPEVLGNLMTVPHDVTFAGDDMEIRVDITADNWNPGSFRGIFYKATSATTPAGSVWGLGVTTSSRIFFSITDGITSISFLRTVLNAEPFTTGGRIRLRLTYVRDMGSGQYEIRMYTNNTDFSTPLASLTSWTQIGTADTGQSIGATHNLNSQVRLGNRRSVNDLSFAGKYHAAVVIFSGTTVLDIDCDAITDGSATSFQAVTDQTVSINRSTSGRKIVAVPSRSLKKWDDPHVYLPGVFNNSLSVENDIAQEGLTADLDLRFDVALSGATTTRLLHRRSNAFQVEITAQNVLRFIWTESGGGSVTAVATDGTGVNNDARIWIRVTLDVDNGAGGYDVNFYRSGDGTTWQQIGSTITGGSTTDVASVTTNTQAWFSQAAAKVYRVVTYSDLTETNKVIDIDCAKAPTNFTAGNNPTFLADTGQTVTLNSTANSGMEVRGTRFSSGRSLFLLGTDDYFQCVGNWQHQLLNFEQQDSFTVVAVLRQWPTPEGRFISKGFTNAPFTGWQFLARTNFGFHNNSSRPSPAGIAGAVSVMSYVINQTAETESLGVGNLQNVYLHRYSSIFFVNQLPMRIGRNAQGTVYSNIEFTAAAVFRKALTPDEIKTITDYYQNRGF